MSTATTVRPDFRTLMTRVRAWTERTGQPLMPWIHEAIRIQLDFEESVPRCSRCGSVDVEYRCGYYATGVTAPDGGCEARWEEYRECMRCGSRQEL